jgi:hypothetical protein
MKRYFGLIGLLALAGCDGTKPRPSGPGLANTSTEGRGSSISLHVPNMH